MNPGEDKSRRKRTVKPEESMQIQTGGHSPRHDSFHLFQELALAGFLEAG